MVLLYNRRVWINHHSTYALQDNEFHLKRSWTFLFLCEIFCKFWKCVYMFVFCVLYDLCEELVNNSATTLIYLNRLYSWHIIYLNISSNEHLTYKIYMTVLGNVLKSNECSCFSRPREILISCHYILQTRHDIYIYLFILIYWVQFSLLSNSFVISCSLVENT